MSTFTLKASADKLSPTARKIIVKTLEALSKEYELDRPLVVGTRKMPANEGAETGFKGSDPDAPFKMNFNAHQWGDEALDLHKWVKDTASDTDEESGLPMHGNMTDPAYIVRHEFGHAVLFTLLAQRGRGELPTATMDALNLIYKDYMKARMAGLFGSLMVGSDIAAPTAYALQEPHEFFAECFAAVEYGDETAKATNGVKHMAELLRLVKTGQLSLELAA